METFMNDAILFIQQYRKMEKADYEVNERFIRRVVSPQWQADHLCDSWAGRKNNFGSFFLNLSHYTQADFMEAWGIEVAGKQEYKTALEENPMAIIDAKPPTTVIWLSELVKYFYNNGIGDRKDLILDNLPVQGRRYGTSKNWGNYILSLSIEDRELVLKQLYNHVMCEKL